MPHSDADEITPRILFLDAYDSFSNNIVALLKSKTLCHVDVIKIDDPAYSSNNGSFERLLKCYDAVVAGPGPGTPTCKADVGLIGRLWHLGDSNLIPVLGICLGFQSLACAFGGQIEILEKPRHGIVQQVQHQGTSLFKGTEQIFATQYHSLCINLDHETRSLASATIPDECWKPSKSCPELLPLAWVLGDKDNGITLMSIKHVSKPLWAVQFHPESICSDNECQKVVTNWWDEAREWRRTHPANISVASALKCTPTVEEPFPLMKTPPAKHPYVKVLWDVAVFGNYQVTDICNLLGYSQHNKPILLESGTTMSGRLVNAETGRFSIIGLTDDVEHLQYYVASRILRRFVNNATNVNYDETVLDIWNYLAEYMKQISAIGGSPVSPFWGGLIGFVSYEACLDTIGIDNPDKTLQRPDLWFLNIQRSLIIDHGSNQIYIQSTRQHDERWIANITTILESRKNIKLPQHHLLPPDHGKCYVPIDRVSLTNTSSETKTIPRNVLKQRRQNLPSSPTHRLKGPSKQQYTQKVLRCQQSILSGDAYELCLTDQTHITLPASPSTTDPWPLYLRLRATNPSPFAAYLNLYSATSAVAILSSSPERFLSWTRDGLCQFRPIKGTVKKVPGMTREKAEEILSSEKERAENLMIVDLIRHDLHGVANAGNVTVKKLMAVEEYETVYQLVSVIEGRLPKPTPTNNNNNLPPHTSNTATPTPTPLTLLSTSLPPGSMTGAPKLRSCQLLQQIENSNHQPRGIYSGVLGYLDVGGGGDFSVVIRTAVGWLDGRGGEATAEGGDEGKERRWTIGAGGAITSQSTTEGEWEEMLAKREALLKIFDQDWV